MMMKSDEIGRGNNRFESAIAKDETQKPGELF